MAILGVNNKKFKLKAKRKVVKVTLKSFKANGRTQYVLIFSRTDIFPYKIFNNMIIKNI